MNGMDRQERLERTASMANNKGLLNKPGENNCFLNSAVQVSRLNLSTIYSTADGDETATNDI